MIKDIFQLENVIEELESNLSEIETTYNSAVQKLEDMDIKIEETKKNCRKSWICALVIILVAPIMMRFVRGLAFNESFMQIIQHFFVLSWFEILSSEIMVFLPSMWAIKNLNPFKINTLRIEKMKKQSKTKDLEIEISHLEEVLTKNKEELKQLEEQKEKNNIQNKPVEVQEVSYKEALEIQKALLTQMKYQKSCEEKQAQEATKSKGILLNRFKKKNN